MLENISSVMEYKNLYDKIDNYEVISFDVFDTLVKRDVKEPKVVFNIIEKKINNSSFARDRIEAEKKARLFKKEEITLDDIYQCMPAYYDKIKIKKIEIETEIELSVPNKDLLPFYNYCTSQKKVILISDMYLDKNTIKKILEKCGFLNYIKLYVSSEFGVTKCNGNLFHIAIQDMKIKKDKLLHIGNSFRADYLSAKKNGIHSIKLPTYKNRMIYKRTSLQQKKLMFSDYIDSFINNHTNDKSDIYYRFGFEKFGPLVYGYTTWLFEQIKQHDIDQVLFFARDGYILKRAYETLGYAQYVPCEYFEASRRSIRVPFYTKEMDYQDMVNSLTVPSLTNVTQILDSWGLDANNYLKILDSIGIKKDDVFLKDGLLENEKIHNLYNLIRIDIQNNSKKELILLNKYLEKFDFNKKTAIVDIGWGGSMQKYLEIILNRKKIPFHIIGFYMGLTKKSKDNLSKGTAYGYLFDSLNNDDSDLERPFVGLFETLFLEQKGSVKNYIVTNKGDIEANRYEYEYENSREEIFVSNIQDGAIDFIKQFDDSILSKYIEFSSEIMFSYLQSTGLFPNHLDIDMFGSFDFFNNGTKVQLANPKPIWKYISNIKLLKKDLYDSQWKVGFLKDLFKIKMDYNNIYEFINKYVKKQKN